MLLQLSLPVWLIQAWKLSENVFSAYIYDAIFFRFIRSHLYTIVYIYIPPIIYCNVFYPGSYVRLAYTIINYLDNALYDAKHNSRLTRGFPSLLLKRCAKHILCFQYFWKGMTRESYPIFIKCIKRQEKTIFTYGYFTGHNSVALEIQIKKGTLIQFEKSKVHYIK